MNIKFDLLKLRVRFFDYVLMDLEFSEYVTSLKQMYMDKNELNVIYYKDGNKLKKLFSDNSNSIIMKTIRDYIENYDHEPGYAYVMITLRSRLEEFRYGPVSLMCTLLTIDKNNKLNLAKSAVGVVRYSIDELKTRKFKTTDYKKLYNKVRKGQLTKAGRVYYAKDLDKI